VSESKGPARGYSWPPAEPGNELAVKHGATAVLKLAPRAGEIAERIRAIVPAGSDHDEPTVRLLAGVLARIEAANAWLAANSIFADGEGNAQPILKQLSTWENTAGRLCEKLGLTPTSRAELGLDLARMHLTVVEAEEFVEALRRELEPLIEDKEALAAALERAARTVSAADSGRGREP
jgi:hypothetical protein